MAEITVTTRTEVPQSPVVVRAAAINGKTYVGHGFSRITGVLLCPEFSTDNTTTQDYSLSGGTITFAASGTGATGTYTIVIYGES